jgi:hypothetical protein
VIEFELGVEALGATRIGYSPLGEVASSVRAWRDGAATSLLGPLLGEVERHVSAADLGLLGLIVPRGGLVPDLLYPADIEPTTTVCDQLAGLAAMPLADYTAEMVPVWAPAPVPAPLAGERGRTRLVDALRRYAEATLGPAWPNIRAAIDAEVAQRGGQALERGLGGLFGDLHPELRLDGSVLTIAKAHHSCPEQPARR